MNYVINYIAKKIGAKSYLEIGKGDEASFNQIEVDYKVGIDTNSQRPNTTQPISDEFFEYNKETFDIIMVNGVHHVEQVYKDIVNALSVLSPDGYIICHDTLPTSEDMQTTPFRGGM